MTETKICSICNIEKDVTDFHKKRNGRTHRCKSCEKAYQLNYYKKNRDKRIETAKIHSSKIVQKNRELVVEHLRKNPCVDCGERDILTLQFDHLENKKKAIAVMLSTTQRPPTTKRLLEEMSKCVVRCANCHQRKTAKESNYWKLQYI